MDDTATASKRIISGLSIRGAIDAIVPNDGLELGRVHALNPAHVYPVFIGVCAALMMGVNPTDLTKMVLRGVGPKAVARKVVRAANHRKIADIDRDCWGCTTATK